MTTAPPNRTRTCIEEAFASAEYGEKVINLGNQYRREGNHIAANAALATILGHQRQNQKGHRHPPDTRTRTSRPTRTVGKAELGR